MATPTNYPDHIRNPRPSPKKNGGWEIRFTRKTPDGKYKSDRQSCFDAKTYADAQDFLKVWLEDQWSQTGAQTRTLKIEELCRRYLEHIEASGRTIGTRYSIKPVRQALGHLTAEQVTPAVLQDYLAQRGMKSGTMRRELTALKAALNFAADRDLIDRSTVPKFDMPPDSPPRTLHMEQDQEQFFWDQAIAWGHRTDLPEQSREAAYRVMLFVTLGLSTAARRGAIHQLTWDRVDLAHQEIDFRVPGERRTNKRKVWQPIADRLLPVLQEAALRAPKDVTGRPVGRVVDAGRIWRAFLAFTTAIGMPWVTAHVMRHTWATLSARAGMPLDEIAAIMGDGIERVIKTYTHYTPGHLRDTINRRNKAAA